MSWLVFEGQADVLMLGQLERLKWAENPMLVNGLKLLCHDDPIVTGWRLGYSRKGGREIAGGLRDGAVAIERLRQERK